MDSESKEDLYDTRLTHATHSMLLSSWDCQQEHNTVPSTTLCVKLQDVDYLCY
jgi:hypothetical protein